MSRVHPFHPVRVRTVAMCLGSVVPANETRSSVSPGSPLVGRAVLCRECEEVAGV
jgi:hypothetical protein